MGLKEQIQVGAKLTRDVITLTDTVGSGSVALGGTYAILSIQPSQASRLRLYDTIASRDDVTEVSRTFGASTVPTNIALVGDYSMSVANNLYTITPASIGHADNASTPLTYYRVFPAGSSFKINRLLIEDTTKPPVLSSAYVEDNRRLIQITPLSSIAALGYASGSKTSTSTPTVPKTYMLVSASLANSAHMVRMRLYNVSSSIYNITERNRAFSTEASESVGLIADIILSGSNTVYFTPKITGANLQNMGNDLSQLVTNPSKMEGINELYYYMQNLSSSGSPITPTVNLYTFSLED